MNSWRTWLHSLIAAAIGGAASSLSAAIVAPSIFNFTHHGMVKMGQLALFGAAPPVLALLKQSPLPASQVTVTQSETVTVEKKD
jgi:hypothetical protein